MERKFARKSFITKDTAQLKILSLLLISMLVPVFFVGSFLYFLIFKILSDQPNIPGFTASALDPVIRKTNLAIIVTFTPLFILLLAWGVIFSHRLIGPLQRIQKNIDRMAKQGDLKARLNVRKYDYIKPLVDSINSLLDKLAK